MSRPWSRSASNSGSRSAARARLATQPVLILASADCSAGFCQRRVGVVLEGERGRLPSTRSLTRSRLADRRRGDVAGQHLGDMARLHGRAQALEPAGHVHQAAEIARQQQLGAGGLDAARPCCDTIRVEISGYLTQKVPPKPQQTSLSSISTQRQPVDAGQELRAAGA